MDLRTHIKNHQILWGSGISFVIFVSFIGGMILVNSKPWESESSSTSSVPETSSKGTVSSTEENSNQNLYVQNENIPSTNVFHGKVKEITEDTLTLTPLQISQFDDSKNIQISKQTSISLVYQTIEGSPAQKDLNISNIKQGDQIRIQVQTSDQTATQITIFSEDMKKFEE